MSLHLTPLVIVFTILATAFAALLSQMALAVFNDGVRPFLLDFYRGELARPQMTAIAFGLSAGFIFGLGVPVAFSSGVLNPWVLFLPSDILGILSPRKWIAPILGAAWGAVVVFGLSAATTAANSLPVNFLTAMQQMSTPILYLFSFFPAVAVTMQFGRLRGIITFVVSIFVMLFTMKWLPSVFPGATTMAIGVILLVAFAVAEEVTRARSERQKAQALQATEAASPGAASAEEDDPPASASALASAADDETSSIFAANAARLRRHAPYFMIMGLLLGVLVNTHMFAGGEATSYVIAKGQFANAAQIDFYRALGFIPLIVTTAVASGAFQIVGFTLIYPVAYLLPNPILAAIAGALLFGIEVFILSYIAKGIAALHTIRDASDNIRNAINLTLEVAILFGSLAAGNAMASGLGIAIVGGLYALNEVLGRPVVRMAAGPVGVIIAGIALNLLAYAHLFTPIPIK
ncbi:YhfT family protein [Thermogemmatispora tikiterensis]|uniref:Permease n=1 Tax=Thermogemmatispora tikiterensis TaxID=1825093 RepID=A0A328VP95_9CHLR|nr:YhfT family protein [Thermogemmatispora tikiterensis]RAQ97600.1 permease [Thermogemmatispora tikiterensis]